MCGGPGGELGLRTAALEVGTDDSYPCSLRWAGGIFHVAYHDVKLRPDELPTAINRQTSEETGQELAAAITADAAARPMHPPQRDCRLV